MCWRIGTVLLVPLLFAGWADNLMAEFLPPDALGVVTPPTLQPATVSNSLEADRLEPLSTPPAHLRGDHGDAIPRSGVDRMEAPRHRRVFLPSGPNLLYLTQSLQQ